MIDVTFAREVQEPPQDQHLSVWNPICVAEKIWLTANGFTIVALKLPEPLTPEPPAYKKAACMIAPAGIPETTIGHGWVVPVGGVNEAKDLLCKMAEVCTNPNPHVVWV